MKKSCISLFLALFSANSFLLEVSSHFQKFKGFSWESCAKLDDPVHVKTLHVYPNPIPSPGYVLAPASATTLIDLLSPLPVNLTLKKEVAGAWVKIPCVDDRGSCYYPDACDGLVQDFMIFTGLCPSPSHSSSFSCGCPLKAAVFQELEPSIQMSRWNTNQSRLPP